MGSDSRTAAVSDQVAYLQLLDLYYKGLNIDLTSSRWQLHNQKSEREWDGFFRRLEERFLALDIQDCAVKQKLLRRILRAPHLQRWVAITSQEPNYEKARDALYKEFFSNSELYGSLLKALAASSTAPLSSSEGNTPATAAASGDELGTAPAMNTSGEVSGATKRGTSLNAIRDRSNMLRENIQRVASRYDQALPSEEMWLQWAISLMRPTTYDIYQALAEKPSTLTELFTIVVEPESAASERRNNGSGNRRYRRRNNQGKGAKQSQSTSSGAAGGAQNTTAAAVTAL